MDAVHWTHGNIVQENGVRWPDATTRRYTPVCNAGILSSNRLLRHVSSKNSDKAASVKSVSLCSVARQSRSTVTVCRRERSSSLWAGSLDRSRSRLLAKAPRVKSMKASYDVNA